MALEEIFKKGTYNIIGRRPQEIFPKLEEKVRRKHPGPKVGRKLEENIPKQITSQYEVDQRPHIYTLAPAQFFKTEIFSVR